MDDKHEPTIIAWTDVEGWVCPVCWETSDGTYGGHLEHRETVDRVDWVNQERSTATSLAFTYMDTTDGSGIDERIECRTCLTRFAIPSGVEIEWN